MSILKKERRETKEAIGLTDEKRLEKDETEADVWGIVPASWEFRSADEKQSRKNAGIARSGRAKREKGVFS